MAYKPRNTSIVTHEQPVTHKIFDFAPAHYTDKPLFVVQEHHATSLHYDFRLQVKDVLVSWAVPKGVPTRAGIKRLAIYTTDHALDYANFEGIIPEGCYGAGLVHIVDKGYYQTIKKDKQGLLTSLEQCLKNGLLEFVLYGKKYKGRYALVRTSLHDTHTNWLLMKLNKNSVEDK